MTKIDENKCYMCGTCCTAYSISTLNKKGGVACQHLNENKSCGIYDSRPQVCRDFKADNLCTLISSLPDEQKLAILNKVYMD